MSAVLISAFPGMGKTYAYKLFENDIKVLDLDSSQFDKYNFPGNYVRTIMENISSYDLIFISSHKEVRDMLDIEGIHFDLFYPDKERKNEFIENYVIRHSKAEFIKNIDANWNTWIDEIENENNEHCHLHCLKHKGEFVGNNNMILQYVEQVKNNEQVKKKETSETKEVEKYDIDFTGEDLSLLVKLRDDLWNVATNKDDNTDKLTLKFKKFEIPTEEFYILSKTIRFIKGKDNGKFSKK